MKKKSLISLVVACFLFLILPFTVKAKEPVTIYFFKRTDCPHCTNASAFFETLKKDAEYKDKFVIEEYIVNKSAEASSLMDAVATKLGDETGSVPYYIIGDKSWVGYSSKTDEEIKKQILTVYNDDSFENTIGKFIAEQTNKKDTTIITVSIIAGVVVIAGVAIYMARKNSDEEPLETEKVVKPIDEKPIKIEKKSKEPKISEEKVKTGKKKQTSNSKKTKTTSKKTSSPKSK